MSGDDRSHKSSTPRRLRVFLCHSSNDKPAVRTLYQHLQAVGVVPWLDEEGLIPGQDWEYEIRKAIRHCDLIMVCLSQGSVTKTGYVQKEIKFALDVANEQPEGIIYLIPLKLEPCLLPERLSQWHAVNFYEERGLERLMKSLEHRAQSLGVHLLLAPKTRQSPLSRRPEITLLPNLRGHTGSVWAVAISPDGDTLVSGGEDKKIKVWSLK